MYRGRKLISSRRRRRNIRKEATRYKFYRSKCYLLPRKKNLFETLEIVENLEGRRITIDRVEDETKRRERRDEDAKVSSI